jgi:dTDP-4-amino-4,6-dideoxygalactose transaminase
MSRPIPFNRPHLPQAAFAYLHQAVMNMHLSGDGPFTRRCHVLLQELLGAPHVLLTTSCTHALEMTALLLDLAPGDEVIVPAYTFTSTVNAYVLRGVRPIFADIREDTLNLDERNLDRLITRRTRAIIPVHYAGVACDMDTILRLANEAGIAVVEDNAHGLLGRYRGKNLGTFGCLATQSFHETKNFQCGEGGALVINDHRFTERAEILREKGTNRSRYFRGEIDKYTWVDMGSSFLPSDALAALLLAQLEDHEHIQRRRAAIWNSYRDGLAEWAMDRGVRLPHVPDECEQPAHLFYMILPTLEDRQVLLAHLKAQGVFATFHYQPLHLSDMGRRFGGRENDCPVTEWLSDRLLRLPLYPDLTDADVVRVTQAVKSCALPSQRSKAWSKEAA